MKNKNIAKVVLGIPEGKDISQVINKIQNIFEIKKISKEYKNGLCKRLYIDLK
ncbi:hypothetical protein [Clostridium sp. AWRP]|uniref:hypothetical protein n=1 Tax=Clostridium sp. AWRP TaxID=2212991 RepID=UPI001586AE17|nr:hypothetical protein [Clostridium sp. AWRP]